MGMETMLLATAGASAVQGGLGFMGGMAARRAHRAQAAFQEAEARVQLRSGKVQQRAAELQGRAAGLERLAQMATDVGASTAAAYAMGIDPGSGSAGRTLANMVKVGEREARVLREGGVMQGLQASLAGTTRSAELIAAAANSRANGLAALYRGVGSAIAGGAGYATGRYNLETHRRYSASVPLGTIG